MTSNLAIGDVVQIDPTYDDRFGGCFMVVTEPKSWGAQGYVVSPEKPGARFFYRVKKENCEWVGQATWLMADDEGETAEVQP